MSHVRQQKLPTVSQGAFGRSKSGDNDVNGSGAPRRQHLLHRNSWPTNGVSSQSQRSLKQAQLNSLQEDDKGASTKLDTQQDARRARDSEFDQENPQDGTTTTAASPSTSDADERTNVGCNREDNGIGQVVTNASCRRPSPASQRRIIKSLSSTTPVTVVRESNDTRPPSTDWTYTVSRVWYRRWEDYVGRAPRGGASPSSVRRVDCPSPGPVEMDSEDDDRNLFVSEDVWKRLVSWYGVSANHQLNRRNSVESDEKAFDICLLSPFSGIIAHRSKRFSRCEEVGYVELQLRRFFKVDSPEQLTDNHLPRSDVHRRWDRRRCRHTRLWITEKATIPRFQQLLDRAATIGDFAQRDKSYTLALEVADGSGAWPTGEPGDPSDELDRYAALYGGERITDAESDSVSVDETVKLWNDYVDKRLAELTHSISADVRQANERFHADARRTLADIVTGIEQRRLAAEARLRELDDRSTDFVALESSVADRERELRTTADRLAAERATLADDERAFREEMMTSTDDEGEDPDVRSMTFDGDARVRLDVGGKVYTTSVHTLRRYPDSVLGAAFSGRYQLHRAEDGSYFVDRDGRYFRHVLNFMRDGRLDDETRSVALGDRSAMRELVCEAKFYRLLTLVEQLAELWKQSNGTDS